MSWLREWFDGILDSILAIPEFFKEWMKQAHHNETLYVLDNSFSKESLDKYYNSLSPERQKDPDIEAHYLARKADATAAGFEAPEDLAAGFIGTQIRKAVGLVTNQALGKLQPEFEKFYDKEKIPKEAQDSINAIAASGEFGLNAVVGFMLGHFLSPVLSTSLAPVWETAGQEVWKKMPYRLIDPGRLIDLTFRDAPNAAKYDEQLNRAGFDKDNIVAMKKQFEFIPTPRDVILWAVREAFYPDYIEEYGLHDEYPTDAMKKYGSLSGLPNEYAEHFWHSHWELPSLSMGYNMLHRSVPEKLSPNSKHTATYGGKDYYTVIGSEDLDKLFMAQDIMPWWRDKLKAISYHPITRVDLRRMWDMRVITKEQVRKGYLDLGYNEENATLMTIWTIIYVLAGDLKDRYKKGWINEMQVKDSLIAGGMPIDRVEEWVETIIESVGEERTAKERDLTKAEIIKGIKKNVIDADQGRELLVDLGYEEWEAAFLLEANVAWATGSPHSFQEFKVLTELYKKAHKRTAHVPDKEILEAEKEYRKNPTTENELKYRDLLKAMEEEN